MEPIPFYTGRTLSTAAFEEITAGTDVSALTTAQAAAKNRLWRITTTTAGANLPQNYYRSSVVVDNVNGTESAWVVNTTDQDPAYTLGHYCVPAGTSVTFSRDNGLLGTEAMAVVLQANSAVACIVTERSFN